jgi:flagellar hook protein FlgE
MSLYGMMRTGVSGMAAQSTRLATVADNIANSGTNGYKRASVEFSSLVIPNAGTNYVSGGVATTIRYAISQAGNTQYTTSGTDLSISGNGFFVVQNSNGQPFLTRAGSFVPDAEGRLVNAAGFYLLGYSYENGIPSPVANGYAGLTPVTIPSNELQASPTTLAKYYANLPYTASPVAAANLPSTNSPTAEFTEKRSLVVYDNVGQEVLLDIFFTRTGAGDPTATPPTVDTWEMSVFYQPNAAATTSFPYSQPALTSATLEFDNFGKLIGPATVAIDLSSLNGEAIEMDISGMTQLAADFTQGDVGKNGAGPSAVEDVVIGVDGILYTRDSKGNTTPLYRLPVANVQSPDQLRVMPGNVFAVGPESGDVQIGFAGSGGLGDIISGSLENSNVDIAEELTNMIESQRNYTANSKVFQTGSDLMDVLVNLKR